MRLGPHSPGREYLYRQGAADDGGQQLQQVISGPFHECGPKPTTSERSEIEDHGTRT